MKHFLELLRPVNCFMAAVAVFIGAFITGFDLVSVIDKVALAMASAFLICGAGMSINDYIDRENDFYHKSHRPIPSRKISPKGALVYSIMLFVIGLYLAFFVNRLVFVLALVNSALLVFYSLYFQRILFLSNALVSLLAASTFIYGGLVVESIKPALILAALAFFTNTGREIFKDIQDWKSDIKFKIISMPIVIGEKGSAIIASIFVLIGVAMAPLPYLLNMFGDYYLYLVIPSILVFLQAVKKPKKTKRLLKYAMLIALAAFMVGRL
jgi:geranylgeranylglycerol-phosphate geranylgeranyltransferase